MNYINQLSNIESQSVLVIGDVMVDSYIWGAVDRISPEAPVPVVNVTETENRLGGAANVVKNIAALHLNPILCTVVGDDEAAIVLFELLEKDTISTKYCIKSPQRKTTLKTRILSGNHQILRVDTEHTNAVSPELTNEMSQIVQKLLASHSISAIKMLPNSQKNILFQYLLILKKEISLILQMLLFLNQILKNLLKELVKLVKKQIYLICIF